MRSSLFALACVLLCASSATGQEYMSGSAARTFVAGKLFSFSCFEGTHGAGRIFPDGSVEGRVRFADTGNVRYMRLPPGTLYVREERVCATLRGMPSEPCFTLTRTSPYSFRGAISGLGFMYCDFTHQGRRILAKRRLPTRQASGSVSGTAGVVAP